MYKGVERTIISIKSDRYIQLLMVNSVPLNILGRLNRAKKIPNRNVKTSSKDTF